MNLGAPEILLILGILVLIFGATRLPKLARGIGQSAKEFRKGLDEGSSTEGGQAAVVAPPGPAAAPAAPPTIADEQAARITDLERQLREARGSAEGP